MNDKNLTIEQYLRQRITPWIDYSVKICEGKCIISGRPYEVVHHKYPFYKIVYETFNELKIIKKKYINEYNVQEINAIENKCLEIHFKYGAGACLINEIHVEFHELYSNKENTICQFEEFMHIKKKNFDLNEDEIYINNDIILSKLEEVTCENNLIYFNNNFYIENNGNYSPISKTQVQQICFNKLGNLGKIQNINKMLKLIEIKTYTSVKPKELCVKDKTKGIDTFFDEVIVKNDIKYTLTKDLYNRYKQYCIEYKIYKILSDIVFGREIARRFGNIKKRISVNGERPWVYSGITF